MARWRVAAFLATGLATGGGGPLAPAVFAAGQDAVRDAQIGGPGQDGADQRPGAGHGAHRRRGGGRRGDAARPGALGGRCGPRRSPGPRRRGGRRRSVRALRRRRPPARPGVRPERARPAGPRAPRPSDAPLRPDRARRVGHGHVPGARRSDRRDQPGSDAAAQGPPPGAGLGPTIAFSWTRARFAAGSGVSSGTGLRVRPVMAGLQYGLGGGRTSAAASVVAGYAFNGLQADTGHAGGGAGDHGGQQLRRAGGRIAVGRCPPPDRKSTCSAATSSRGPS